MDGTSFSNIIDSLQFLMVVRNASDTNISHPCFLVGFAGWRGPPLCVTHNANASSPPLTSAMPDNTFLLIESSKLCQIFLIYNEQLDGPRSHNLSFHADNRLIIYN